MTDTFVDRPLALRAEGVRMEYRDPATRERLVAIERIDCEIHEGEFVSIVGPSGCGKSTFLKVVNGLLPATDGEIEIRRSGKGQDHAMVFQDSSLFPWYTVIRNVAPDIPLSEVIWGTLPFVLLMMVAVVVLCFVPEISTGLPNLVMGPDGSR